METNTFAAGGPIFLGVLIALTVALKWPNWVHYLWSALAIIWGVIALA
ncbi:MAG: hypothetical protein AAB499_02970 [Patescibacteria group bacterium]